jgi:hypothetical protein
MERQMPAIVLTLIIHPDEREHILANIPPEIVPDIRTGFSCGGMERQPFPLRLAEVARILRAHFEAQAAKDEGDAHK